MHVRPLELHQEVAVLGIKLRNLHIVARESADGGADGDAASDVKQFLDVDPPASPASEADIPAPPG